MKKSNLIQILGMVSGLLSIAATMFGKYVDDQQMKEEVNIQVNKALAERETKENENKEES